MNCVLCVMTMIVDSAFQKWKNHITFIHVYSYWDQYWQCQWHLCLWKGRKGLSTGAEWSLRYRQLGNSFLTNLTRDAKVNEF